LAWWIGCCLTAPAVVFIGHLRLCQARSFATACVSPVGIAVSVWHTLTAAGHYLISNPYRSSVQYPLKLFLFSMH